MVTHGGSRATGFREHAPSTSRDSRARLEIFSPFFAGPAGGDVDDAADDAR